MTQENVGQNPEAFEAFECHPRVYFDAWDAAESAAPHPASVANPGSTHTQGPTDDDGVQFAQFRASVWTLSLPASVLSGGAT